MPLIRSCLRTPRRCIKKWKLHQGWQKILEIVIIPATFRIFGKNITVQYLWKFVTLAFLRTGGGPPGPGVLFYKRFFFLFFSGF